MTVFRSTKREDAQQPRYDYFKHDYDNDVRHYEVNHCDCESSCSCDDDNYSTQSSPSYNDPFNFNNDATVSQGAGEYSFMEQESAELIWVKESCDIRVNTTDTQVGASLQAALQLAIAVVLRLTIGDSERSEEVAQEMTQYLGTNQTNKQKIYIYNTKDATVTTTDLDLAVNIQLLLQLLVAIVIMIDIL